MSRTATCVVAVALLVCACAEARIHDLTITTDSRAVFGIEDFGFVSGGTIQMDVSGFKVITDVRSAAQWHSMTAHSRCVLTMHVARSRARRKSPTASGSSWKRLAARVTASK